MTSTDRLPVTIEYGIDEPSREDLERALGRIGGEVPTLVARYPFVPGERLALIDAGDGTVEVEYGVYHGPTFRTTVAAADLVGRVVAWAVEEDGWREAMGGEVVAEFEEPGPPDAEVVEEAEELARDLVLSGYRCHDEVVEAVAETCEIDEDEAAGVVDPIWMERASEQRSWGDETDNGLLREVFEELSSHGLTTAEDFSCCLGCGVAEIRSHGRPDDHGFVFFHEQDTVRAARGGGLLLAFGAYGGDEQRTVAIGNRVVEALTYAGLDVEWDGTAGTRITVSMDWRRRLPSE